MYKNHSIFTTNCYVQKSSMQALNKEDEIYQVLRISCISLYIITMQKINHLNEI